MNSVLVIQSLISGIMMGAVYALLGVGFSLTWGVMKVIHISHATFGLLGAFLAYTFLKWWHLDPILSLAIVISNDRSSTNIDLLRNFCISNIAKMLHFNKTSHFTTH